MHGRESADPKENRQVKGAGGRGMIPLLPVLPVLPVRKVTRMPGYFAAAKRSATAFQFTTFQKAST